MRAVTRMLVIAAAAVAIFATHEANARSLSEIVSSGEIRLGYVIYPPLATHDQKTGQVSGLIPDALSAALGPSKLKVKWIEVNWSTFAAALQSDQIDVFTGATFVTPTRALSLAFTEPYAYAGNTLVVRKQDAEGRFKGYSSYHDFDRPDVTVATLIGGQSYEWAKAHFTKAKVIGIQSPDPNAHSLEVMSGRADVAYTEASTAAKYVDAHSGELTNLFRKDPFNVTPFSWAVKQNEPALVAFLNSTLEYMSTNGTWDELEQGKYKSQLEGIYHVKRDYYVAGSSK